MLLLNVLLMISAIVADERREFQTREFDVRNYQVTIENDTLLNIEIILDEAINIDLAELGIRHIQPNVFDHLNFVETLTLENNFIRELPQFVFRNLTNLKWLSLADNPITKFHNVFVGLVNLETLVISCENINYFDKGYFFGLPKSCNILMKNANKFVISAGAFENPLTPEPLVESKRNEIPGTEDINDMVDSMEGNLYYENFDFPSWNKNQRVKICINNGIVLQVDFITEHEKLIAGCKEVRIDYEERTLLLDNMNITTFQKGWYQIGNYPVRMLNFVNNQIKQIRSEMTDELPANIEAIDVSYNMIQYFEQSIVNERLKVLKLENNFINDIDDGALERTKIEFLDLIKNNINNSRFAKKLPNSLKTLQIQNNNIEVITDDSFSKLDQLVGLHITFNRITRLESNSFRGLVSLRYLRLPGNRLTNIPTGCFRDLKNLRYLNLVGNLINNIENGAFDGLKNLVQLDIGENLLTKITSDNLRGLTNNLSFLWLRDNKITSLTAGTFENVPTEGLFLANNIISKIETGSLDLPTLRFLDLSGNELSVIDGDSFRSLQSLDEINLTSNRIMTIKNGFAKYLGNLETLDLSSNLIEKLENGALFGLRKSCEIFMLENPIKRIQGGIFDDA